MNSGDINLYGVEARITSIQNPTVYLYKALPVNVDKPFSGVSGATITIDDDREPISSITLKEDPDSAGYYVVPSGKKYFGVPGRKYTLTIQTQNVILTASDTLSRVEPIDSIEVKPSQRGDGMFLGIFTFGRETPGMGNYYKWNIYINDTLLNNAQTTLIASDEFVDGNYIDGLEIYTDFHDPRIMADRKIKYLDTVLVSQLSISKFVYNYYYQVINQSTAGSLFSVPPANIESNFKSSDGKPVLGLFTASDISFSNTVVIDSSIEKQLKVIH